MDDLTAWLKTLGLECYAGVFADNDVDWDALHLLTEKDLEALGVSLGHRKKLLKALAELGKEPAAQDAPASAAKPSSAEAGLGREERRQLTVMFCDLVGSTELSRKLDPEDLREVMHKYQSTARGVIERYGGHVAQYLGDGLMVYFGWPRSHDDEAARAARSALEIVERIGSLRVPIELAVRIGIATGLVVVGEGGAGDPSDPRTAVGETPNLAARLQGLAGPNAILVSALTRDLAGDGFVYEDLGSQNLKGVEAPVRAWSVKEVRAEEGAVEEALRRRALPLVGREEEIGLLRRAWQQCREGRGHVVHVTGEPGIGKTALVDILTQHVRGEGSGRIVVRCSAYHTNSALYPVIEHVKKMIGWRQDGAASGNVESLERTLRRYNLPPEEFVPPLGSLMTLPLPEDRYPPRPLKPQETKQRIFDCLTEWQLLEAERQPTAMVWEDLHWADPSTLEYLGQLIEQVPTASLLLVLTSRPDFTAPWPHFSHHTPITLGRLERPQIEAMVRQLAGDKALPQPVVEHVVRKTDGVPLFVEELTKAIFASGILREDADRFEQTGPLSAVPIPATLHESLMSRLDRLPAAKEVAQLGAVLGREFAYEMMSALGRTEETTLRNGLDQLVAGELLYQRGRPPRAKYVFKHALIQDAAYQSLLKRTRRQFHRDVAQLLESRIPEHAEPELVAHHYTEANCPAQAVAYWQQAGERALRCSANLEAISHLTKGLDILSKLPDAPEHAQRELMLQISLGVALTATKGWGAPPVGQAYMRAWQLTQQLGATEQVCPVLRGLWAFHAGRGEHRKAREAGEEFLRLAHEARDPLLLVEGNHALGFTLFCLGEWKLAEEHVEQGIACHEDQSHRALPVFTAFDLGIAGLFYAAVVKWHLGYPDQAVRRRDQALALARELNHPFSLAYALFYAAWFHQLRREETATQEHADELVALANERGFAVYTARGSILKNWAQAQLGAMAGAVGQMRESVAAHQSTGTALYQPYFLALLADTCRKAGKSDEALRLLTEATALMEMTEERFWEPEIHRLRGELLLHEAHRDTPQAESWLRRALDVARLQQAKSLELRAAMSLSRLWQEQGHGRRARQLLEGTYSLFTEGFDTVDLKEAHQLLAGLGR